MKAVLEILIVDDDEGDRALVRRALRETGLQLAFQEADTCVAAIALLQQPFDCAFIDYLLPDGDGLGLVQELRRIGVTVPLIILTAQGDEQIAVEVMKAGAVDYLTKAKVSSESLRRSLQYAVRLHSAEQQAVLANQRLAESEGRFRSLVKNSRDIITVLTAQGIIQYTSPSITAILGYQPEELLGQNAFKGVHPEDVLAFQAVVTCVRPHPSVAAVPVEVRFRHANGSWVYLEAIANNLNDPGVSSLVVNSRDITERKRVEASQRFLAEANSVLAASLDYRATLASLARLVVPTLADFCFFDVITADKQIQRVAWWHKDPAKQEWFTQVQRYIPPQNFKHHPVANVLLTGQADFVPEVSDAWIQAAATSAEHLQSMRDLQFHSLMTVPLIAHDQKLGALTFCLVRDSGRNYTRADLRLAEDLAHRAALALDNARLYHEAQEIGENLRQAILILGEQQQQLRTLQRLTNLLNQRLADLPDLLQVMVNAMGEAIPQAEFCLIMLHNPQSNRLEWTAKAGSGAARLQLAANFQATERLLDQVFLTGLSQLVQGDALSEGQPLPAAICAVAIESAQAGRLGVLAMGNWEDCSAFNAETRYLLSAFGEQAAIALNNARLINALEEREEQLAAQNEILADQNRKLECQRQQIQLQNLQLLEASRLKSQFLATMSHELRTPIHAITGFSQLLLRQRHTLSPPQTDMMERILNNGKNLLALINDILDFSRIEAGRLELRLEEFNLVQQVAIVVEELRSLADQKNLALQVYSELQNCTVVNDPLRLRQILVNLLSNAIKFTDSGSVRVEVREHSLDRLVMVVQDTGIGIAPADLKQIFAKFWQVDQTTTRRFAGTGLGLAITKHLAQLMQGTITVNSDLGKGSTFQIEFPRRVRSTTQNWVSQTKQLLR